MFNLWVSCLGHVVAGRGVQAGWSALPSVQHGALYEQIQCSVSLRADVSRHSPVCKTCLILGQELRIQGVV